MAIDCSKITEHMNDDLAVKCNLIFKILENDSLEEQEAILEECLYYLEMTKPNK